jgi:hypothetical protein
MPKAKPTVKESLKRVLRKPPSLAAIPALPARSDSAAGRRSKRKTAR